MNSNHPLGHAVADHRLSGRVLVIEDEDAIRIPLVDALHDEGLDVLEAEDGDTGLALALREDPDVILLDLMLPGCDGFELLRRLRRDRCTTPVVIMSARGEEWDRLQGFELGADDYVVKPFSMRELLLRVRVQLERARGSAVGVQGAGAGLRELTELCFGDVRVDLLGYTLVRGEDASTGEAITRLELDLLRYLFERPGQVFTRDQLLDAVWGRTANSGPRTVDTHVLKLRKRIEADPAAPKHLLTVRNVGYKFLP